MESTVIHSHIPPNITTDILRLGTPGRRMLFTSCGLRIGHFFCLCPSMLSRCCSTLCCYPRAAHADGELFLIHPPAQVATDLHPIILWAHRLFYVGLACPSLPCLQLAEQTVGLLCLASCFPLGCPGTDYNLCQDCRQAIAFACHQPLLVYYFCVYASSRSMFFASSYRARCFLVASSFAVGSAWVICSASS